MNTDPSQSSNKSSQNYNEEMQALLQRKRDLLQNSKNKKEIDKLIALQQIQKMKQGAAQPAGA